MPFKSKSQMRYLYATHPKLAQQWQAETPNEKLPERVTATRKQRAMDKLKRGMKS